MDFWTRLWRRKQPPAPAKKAHRWGIHRDKLRETGSTLFYAEGRLKQFSHLKLFRIVLRQRKPAGVLELSEQTRTCLDFILESERRAPKKQAAERLFCRTPQFALEVIAVDSHGIRIELCLVGFCVHEPYMDAKTLARKIVEFVISQLEDQEWELSSFFDRSGTGSKLLIMSAMLSAYYHGITRWNQ